MPQRPVVAEGVALLCFPPVDEVFCAAAQQTYASLKVATPTELEAALRRIYPRAVVRERELLASHEPAWYVYRDGRYSPVTSAEPWWEAPDVARTVLDDEGAYLAASPAALDLLGVTCEELVASKAGAFTVPEYQVMIPWIFKLLRDTGEIHSTTMLRPRHGPDIAVEYRFLRDGDGPGRHVSILRSVPLEDVELGSGRAAGGGAGSRRPAGNRRLGRRRRGLVTPTDPHRRVVEAGSEPYVSATRFVTGDAEGADQEFWRETLDGVRLIEPQPRRSTNAW